MPCLDLYQDGICPDHGHHPTRDHSLKIIRSLNIVGALNYDYEGGEYSKSYTRKLRHCIILSYVKIREKSYGVINLTANQNMTLRQTTPQVMDRNSSLMSAACALSKDGKATILY